MPDFLGDYKTYYQLRVKRYEGNPAYPASYASEKAIADAMNSCSSLNEFGEKLGNLNELNAVALVKDEYAIRLRHYTEIKDEIRADGCRRILERAKNIASSAELITMVNEEEQKTSLLITTDSISPFNDPGYLERIRIWSEAETPSRYTSRYRQYVADEKANMKKAYADSEKNMRNWQPGWSFDFKKIGLERHRRLLPYPDAIIQQNIQITIAILSS